MTLSIEAVTFDLDGTLVDTADDIHAAVNRMLADLDRPALDLAAVRGFIGTGERDMIRQCLRATAPDPAGEPDETQIDSVYDRFRQAYLDENGRRARAYPQAAETLAGLRDRGLPLAVVTNKPAAFTEPLLAALELAQYFTAVVSGDSTGQRKPHPLPLLTACQYLGAALSATVHVGDSGIDVATAEAAGCRAVFVSHGYPRDYRPPASLPAIAGFGELPAALARIGRLPASRPPSLSD